jgi:hypothetical protein
MTHTARHRTWRRVLAGLFGIGGGIRHRAALIYLASSLSAGGGDAGGLGAAGGAAIVPPRTIGPDS